MLGGIHDGVQHSHELDSLGAQPSAVTSRDVVIHDNLKQGAPEPGSRGGVRWEQDVQQPAREQATGTVAFRGRGAAGGTASEMPIGQPAKQRGSHLSSRRGSHLGSRRGSQQQCRYPAREKKKPGRCVV